MNYTTTRIVNKSNAKIVLGRIECIGLTLCYPRLKPSDKVVAFDDLDGRGKVF